MSVELPQVVQNQVKRVIDKFSVSEQEVLKVYTEIFNRDIVQKGGFKDDAAKHDYASKLLWVQYVTKPKEGLITVIPYGYSSIREAKKTKEQWLTIYTLSKQPDGMWTKKPITCNKEQVTLAMTINLLQMYEASLVDKSKVFSASPQTSFSDGKSVVTQDKLEEFLTSKLGAKKVTIEEAPSNLSKKTEDGKYTDDTDLRMIQAFVTGVRTGTRESGVDYGVYNLSDGTIDEDKVINGVAVPQQLAAWTHPNLCCYAQGSECMFLGTLAAVKNELQFNCIGVFPIHAQSLQQ